MASEVATMLPTMIFSPSLRASSASSKRLGQAAGFVELDIHRIVATGERRERSPVVHRLVGADRDGSRDARQNVVAAGGQRLLDQLHACRSGGGKKQFDIIGLPGLVGIDDEPRLRDRRTHRGEPVGVAVAAELELEQGISRARLARPGGHRVRRGEREGEGGEHRLEGADPGKRRGAPATPLGLEVP